MLRLFLLSVLCIAKRTAGQNYVNIAMGKTYDQSSKFELEIPSSNAANGDTAGVYWGNNCIHSEVGSAQHWWEVDLGNNYPVYSVKVWGRTGFEHRLYPFKITVDGMTCATRVTRGQREQAVTCSSVITGSRVRLTRTLADDNSLDLCELQIYVCLEGFFGPYCDKRCQQGCNGGCSQDTGVCASCQTGFSGQYCDSQCSTAVSWGCSECTRNNSHCTACKPDYFGDRCQSRCTTISAGCSECSRDGAGCTGCKPGYYGNACDRNCSGLGEGCAECSRGGLCSACAVGYHGSSCQLPCSSVSPQCAQCGRHDGRCSVCGAGFSPPSCTECADGLYGPGCTVRCSRCQRCERQSGQCTACASNLQPPSCSECLDGYYRQHPGSTCTECYYPCYNNTCIKSSGYCARCPPGKRGSYNCAEDCPQNKYGQECAEACGNCKTDWTCNAATGACRQCQVGFKPPLCKQECDVGSYGDGCLQRCGQCKDRAACSKTDGQCPLRLCELGWHPPLCQMPCQDGWFGVNCSQRCTLCPNNAVCNKTNGYCPCPAGKQPPLCLTDCHAKTYGPDCGLNCGHCKDGLACSSVSGECLNGCAPGYLDRSCQTTCRPGLHGEACNQTCGYCSGTASCSHETGICPSGCADGFAGHLCVQAVIQESSNVGMIAGAVVGVVVVVTIAIVVLIILVIRRRRPAAKRDSYSNVPRPASGSGGRNDELPVNPATPANVAGNSPLSFAPMAAESATSKPLAKAPPIAKPARAKKPGASKINSAIYENISIVNEAFDPSTVPDQGANRSNLLRDPLTMSNSDSPNPFVDPRFSPSPKHATNGGKTNEAKPRTHSGIKDKSPGKLRNLTEKHSPKLRNLTEKRSPDTGLALDPDVWTDDEGENVYANEATCSETESTVIRLDSLPNVLVNKLRGGKLADEFLRLSPHKDYPVANGEREENYYKNRFNSILPYDCSRVELPKLDYDDSSDYINASFVKGPSSDVAYIAAQGPKENTVGDFWRMIWQEGVSDIVMLTNLQEGLKHKCHQYWPSKGDKLKTGSLEVIRLQEEFRAFFVIRTFQIMETETKQQRRLTQYQYVNWMDHQVPAATPLVVFWRFVRVRAPRERKAPPLLVHCSAGVGRTGTYIALDILMDQAQEQQTVDIFSCIQQLREDRCHMVQNQSQYEFLHEAFLDAYSSRDTRVLADEFDSVFSQPIRHDIANKRIDAEFEVLKTMKACLAPASYATAIMPDNKTRNRNSKVLPDDKHLVYLTEQFNGRNQYINAVYCSTFLHARGCIMTQLPVPDTVVDFWRLVHGNDVSTVISLGDDHGDMQGSCRYWPETVGGTLQVGAYIVTLDSWNKLGETLFSHSLTVTKEDKTESVQVLHLKGWSGQVPDDITDVLHLLAILAKSSKAPVVVQCLDGASKSGVLCALWDIASRIKADSDVDVYLAVRQVHIVRREAFDSVEQYRYCYQVIQQYTTSQTLYANA